MLLDLLRFVVMIRAKRLQLAVPKLVSVAEVRLDMISDEEVTTAVRLCLPLHRQRPVIDNSNRKTSTAKRFGFQMRCAPSFPGLRSVKRLVFSAAVADRYVVIAGRKLFIPTTQGCNLSPADIDPVVVSNNPVATYSFAWIANNDLSRAEHSLPVRPLIAVRGRHDKGSDADLVLQRS